MKNSIVAIIIFMILGSALLEGCNSTNVKSQQNADNTINTEESNLEDSKENIEENKEATPLDGMKESELKNVGTLSMFKPMADSATLVEAVSNEENIKWYFNENGEYACSFEYQGHNIIIKMTKTSIDIYDNNQFISEDFGNQLAGHLFGEDCALITIKSAIGSQQTYSDINREKSKQQSNSNNQTGRVEFADMVMTYIPINTDQMDNTFIHSVPKSGIAFSTEQLIKKVNGTFSIEAHDDSGFYASVQSNNKYENYAWLFYCSYSDKKVYLIEAKKCFGNERPTNISLEEGMNLIK